jgi:hypothetical protein
MKYVYVLIGIISTFTLNAQKIDSTDLSMLQDYEIRLSGLGEKMVRSFDEETRITSGKNFIMQFSRALRVEGSFYYPFDSLKNVMKMMSPDGLFRIFTWNVATNDEHFRYFGVIQMNPEKLEKLNKEEPVYESFYPLIDRSDSIKSHLFVETGSNYWYGANYYKIVKTSFNKKDYYTLLGWDGADSLINKKIADVLHFKEGKPRFGAPIFDIKRKTLFYRMVFEFNNEATMALRYDEKRKYLIYENIVPDKPENAAFAERYFPDGSFDYMIWNKKGQWEKQPKMLEVFEK